MTNIGFYKIAGNQDDALNLVCQLTEKAFRQQMTVLILTNDQAQTQSLDSLLWSFSATAFLPHTTEQQNNDTILISHENDPNQHHGLLINLTNEIPGWFSRFERTAEIVYDEHSVIEKKREHYKFFKDRGYPIQYHDLAKATHDRAE